VHGLPSPLRSIPWIDPDRAFLALAFAEAPVPGIVFLDSGGPCRAISRWAVLGADPFDVIERGPPPPGGDGSSRDPFTSLGEVLARYRRPPSPLPFAGGGLLGYLGYDLRHAVERLPRRLPDSPEPALWFGLYDALLLFDRLARRAWIVSTGLPETRGRAARLRARERREALLRRIGAPPAGPREEAVAPLEAPPRLAPLLRPAMTPGAFAEAVDRARAWIGAGDIYQVNLSYPVEAHAPLPAARLYDRLRRISPAPFGAYLDPGPFQVLSNSPERFLHWDGERLETRPIKGTRPRSTDPAEDAHQAVELIRSEKDAAEHVMIVDLERNDLGRVAQPGSVCVERLARLESFANVHHLVSIVSAKTRSGVGPVEILRACFPGGSITGAPKIRAMEIIEALEIAPRGIYTGAIGGIAFSGQLNLSVAIRTAVVRDGSVRFHVGGGIVTDSKPEDEYRETVTKGEAFSRALLLDESGARQEEPGGP
jgi:para-aminobenzoate synthetase component 1